MLLIIRLSKVKILVSNVKILTLYFDEFAQDCFDHVPLDTGMALPVTPQVDIPRCFANDYLARDRIVPITESQILTSDSNDMRSLVKVE